MDEHCTEKQATETAQVKFLTVFSSKLSGFWCDVEYSDESSSRYGVEAQPTFLIVLLLVVSVQSAIFYYQFKPTVFLILECWDGQKITPE